MIPKLWSSTFCWLFILEEQIQNTWLLWNQKEENQLCFDLRFWYYHIFQSWSLWMSPLKLLAFCYRFTLGNPSHYFFHNARFFQWSCWEVWENFFSTYVFDKETKHLVTTKQTEFQWLFHTKLLNPAVTWCNRCCCPESLASYLIVRPHNLR